MKTKIERLADLAAEASWADAEALSEVGDDPAPSMEDHALAGRLHDLAGDVAAVLAWVAGLPTSSETPGTFDDGSDDVIGRARRVLSTLGP